MTMPTEPMPTGQHFSDGFDSGRGPMSPSLAAQSARWTQLSAASAERPTSVLQQIGLSPVAQNASAPDMDSRYNAFTGTVMPNMQTGASANTAQTALKLRFAGQEGAV